MIVTVAALASLLFVGPQSFRCNILQLPFDASPRLAPATRQQRYICYIRYGRGKVSLGRPAIRLHRHDRAIRLVDGHR